MTHAECLAMLDAAVPADPRGGAAARHLADCPDCLAAVRQAAAGAVPAVEELGARFACEAVRDRFHLLLRMDVATLAAEAPDAAHHLEWCHACRARFAELVVVEAAAAEGTFDAPVAADPSPTPVQLLGELAVRVGRGIAALARVPEGAVGFPDLLPAGVVRGATTATVSGGPLVRRARFTLVPDDAIVDVQVAPHGTTRIDVELMLVRGTAAPRSVQLRRLQAGGHEELLAWQPLRSAAPAVLRDVPTGAYLLDVGDARGGRRCRISLRIDDQA